MHHTIRPFLCGASLAGTADHVKSTRRASPLAQAFHGNFVGAL